MKCVWLLPLVLHCDTWCILPTLNRNINYLSLLMTSSDISVKYRHAQDRALIPLLLWNRSMHSGSFIGFIKQTSGISSGLNFPECLVILKIWQWRYCTVGWFSAAPLFSKVQNSTRSSLSLPNYLYKASFII